MIARPQIYSTHTGIVGSWCSKPEVLALRKSKAIKSDTLEKAIKQSSMTYLIWILEKDYKMLYQNESE